MRKMKEFLLIIVILLSFALLPLIAARISYYPSGPAEGLGQGSALLSSQIAWNVLDSTTATGTEPSDLAAGERTYVTVLAAIAAASSGDEEISYARVPPSWCGVRFRCIGTTEGGAITYQIYFGSLAGGTDCELAKAGQLAFVIGQQASTTATYEMADAVTRTPYCWNDAWDVNSPNNELVAEAAINLMGADLVVAVPSATDTDCKLLMKGYVKGN